MSDSDIQAQLRELKLRNSSRISGADLNNDYDSFRRSRASGIQRRSTVIKSLEEINSDEEAERRTLEEQLESQLKAQREKETMARAYAHKLLVEKEAALAAQKQQELERLQEQKRLAAEKLKVEEAREMCRKQLEEERKKADEEKQRIAAEKARQEMERSQAEKEKEDLKVEKSLSNVRQKIEENRKKYEQQQKELEDKRAQEELERMRQKALALEREKNRQRMLQANSSNTGEIASITTKLEQQMAFEQRQLETFEKENGFTIENTAKSFFECTFGSGPGPCARDAPPITIEEDQEIQTPTKSNSNGVFDNIIISSLMSPVMMLMNFFFPAVSDPVVQTGTTENEPRMVDMNSFMYTLGTTGFQVLLFLARGKEKGDALFYLSNMKFDMKFDLIFNATTDFGNKELIFPCEVILDVEDGRGYHHGDSQPFTLPYENIASKTMHLKLLNKPDLNIQLETVALKNDLLWFFKHFLKQKLMYKQQKLVGAGLNKFIGNNAVEIQKLLWLCYSYKKTTKMFGLRKGKNIPLLLSLDNTEGIVTLTIWQAPEDLLPINELRNSISKYFDRNYSPSLFEAMGYTSLFSSSLKKGKTVILKKEDFGVEISFVDDEGNETSETICFETLELQEAAGNQLTMSIKEAKKG